MKTTNYYNTLILVADDCPIDKAETPPVKGDKKTIANIQHELISKNPYKYTSDDVIFSGYAYKNDLTDSELESERIKFFSKGQPCLRSSPLTKRYGWGVHSNNEGKIKLLAMESDEYNTLKNDDSITKVMAMRSKRQ